MRTEWVYEGIGPLRFLEIFLLSILTEQIKLVRMNRFISGHVIYGKVIP